MATTAVTAPQYVGAHEAESRSGLSHWLWRKYAHEGRITTVKVGRRLLIPISEIDRIMAEGTRTRRAEYR